MAKTKRLRNEVANTMNKIAFIFLLLLSGCGYGEELYVYSMVVKTTGETDAVARKARVRSVDPPFDFEWGPVGKGGFARYSDVTPRRAITSGVLSWEFQGKDFEVPFFVGYPPKDMIDRISNSGVEVNGYVFKNELELMFEIDPDRSAAKVYWHEGKMTP